MLSPLQELLQFAGKSELLLAFDEIVSLWEIRAANFVFKFKYCKIQPDCVSILPFCGSAVNELTLYLSSLTNHPELKSPFLKCQIESLKSRIFQVADIFQFFLFRMGYYDAINFCFC